MVLQDQAVGRVANGSIHVKNVGRPMRPRDNDDMLAKYMDQTKGSTMRKVAILDDYHDVALSCARWPSLGDGFDITVFNAYLGDENRVAAALADFEVLVAMRERTPFPATVLRW